MTVINRIRLIDCPPTHEINNVAAEKLRSGVLTFKHDDALNLLAIEKHINCSPAFKAGRGGVLTFKHDDNNRHAKNFLFYTRRIHVAISGKFLEQNS